MKLANELSLYGSYVIFFAAFMVFLAACGFYYGNHQIESWHKVEAVVVKSEINQRNSYSEFSSPNGQNNKQLRWHLNIEYQYKYNNITYSNDQISKDIENAYLALKSPKKAPKYMSDLIEKYPIGTQVPILVSPKKPNDSYMYIAYSLPYRVALYAFFMALFACLVLFLRHIYL